MNEHELERGMYTEAAYRQAALVYAKRGDAKHFVPTRVPLIDCALEGTIIVRLEEAALENIDLGILIRKAGVDRDSYIESQATPARRLF